MKMFNIGLGIGRKWCIYIVIVVSVFVIVKNKGFKKISEFYNVINTDAILHTKEELG